MIFQSLDFLVFLVTVFAVYWILPAGLRNAFLLAASYVFYGYVHPWFLWLLWFVTLAVYLSALGIEWRPRHRRLFLIAGCGACVGLLGVFKYFNFFLDNVIAAAAAVGLPMSPWSLRIALPVGISFFAFQGISYVADVYRGDLAARRNLIDVALFKAFFPQLVAGPIERSTHFLPQIERRRTFDLNSAIDGTVLILWGFFKKLAVADNVSIAANKVFALDDPGFALLWAGVLAFCVQIYADFSGYTDIARGTAKLFSLDLMENFNHPYRAESPVDFWRRWHISLSSWFRDYVYIPLGGNRRGVWRMGINVMLTFLLSGLWHGANWNYVLWGGYWGALIVLQNLGAPRLTARLGLPGLRPLRVAAMFVLINLGWLLFRETDLPHLWRFLTYRPWVSSGIEWRAAAYLTVVVSIYALPLALHSLTERWWAAPMGVAPDGGVRALARRTAVATGLFAGILVLRTASPADFIYFQF